MTTKFWTNQTVQIQTALAAAVAITAISKGAVAAVSAAALPADGAYVLLEVTGMRQVHNRVFQVSGSGGGDFTIGVDSTDFDDFVTGTYRVITFGAAFTSLRDITSSGGEPVFEETGTIHDADENQAIVSSSGISYSATSDWDVADPALIEANKAFVSRTPRAIKFRDPDGSEYLFYAYTSAPLQPTVSGRKKVTPINFALRAPGTAA